MKKLLKTTALACAMMLPQLAHAGLVTQWEYEIASEWTGATYEASGLGTTSTTSSVLSWGATGGSYDTAPKDRSALVISNSPAMGNDLVTNSMAYVLTNVITHFNNVLAGGTMSLETALLKTTLKLKPFLPVPGPALPTKELDFTIRFTETANDANCGFDSDSNCDDIFVIEIGNLVNSFTYDGFKYTTTIIETTASLTGLSPAACIEAGALPGCLGFKTIEKAATDAQFGLLIDAVEVSEPAGTAALGLGLLSLFMYGRRRAGK